jgi:hypothetical protein
MLDELKAIPSLNAEAPLAYRVISARRNSGNNTLFYMDIQPASTAAIRAYSEYFFHKLTITYNYLFIFAQRATHSSLIAFYSLQFLL